MSSVVVVGGGIAGLTCAWRLRRGGHDVEVLEAALEVGGRMLTETHGDYRVDFGTPAVSDRSTGLRTVATALGISDQLTPIAATRHAVLRGGSFHRVDLASPFGLARTPLLSSGAKRRLAQLVARAVRLSRQLDGLRPQRAEALDGETFAAAVGPEDECLHYALAPLVRDLCGELREESWGAGLLALRAALEARASSYFRDGAHALPRALAQEIPVRLGCEVRQVESETEGVRVSYARRGRTGRVVADAVVVAVPGDRVTDLCPKLTPDERGFFGQVRYVAGVEVALALPSPPRSLGVDAYWMSFPSADDRGVRALRLEHHKQGAAPDGHALVVASLGPEVFRQPDGGSDEELVDHVLAGLAQTPVGRIEPALAVVRRWPAMTARFGPGSLEQLRRFEQRIDRSPRIAFAGDYLLGNTPEAALTTGARAATEIARRVLGA